MSDAAQPNPTPTAAPAGARTATLFRDEALRHHLLRREFGDVLRLPPAWTRWAYPWIVVMVLGGASLLGLLRFPRYVQGAATLHVGPGDSAWLEARLPALRVQGLATGDRLDVTFAAFPRRSLHAVVVEIAPRPSLDPSAEHGPAQPVLALRARLELQASGADGALPLVDGLPAQVEWLAGRERGVFVLLPGLRP